MEGISEADNEEAGSSGQQQTNTPRHRPILNTQESMVGPPFFILFV